MKPGQRLDRGGHENGLENRLPSGPPTLSCQLWGIPSLPFPAKTIVIGPRHKTSGTRRRNEKNNFYFNLLLISRRLRDNQSRRKRHTCQTWGISPMILSGVMNTDGPVKSPDAALRCIFRHCGVLLCTPHSSRFLRILGECSVPTLRAGTRFARLACELFTKPSQF
jgi:hypothetical protein